MAVGFDEAATLKDVIKIAGTVIVVLIGAVWKMLTGKISGLSKKVDEDMVKKDELERRAQARDVQFHGLRSDIKELYNRDDNLKDHFTAKIDDLRQDIKTDINRVLDAVRGQR